MALSFQNTKNKFLIYTYNLFGRKTTFLYKNFIWKHNTKIIKTLFLQCQLQQSFLHSAAYKKTDTLRRCQITF